MKSVTLTNNMGQSSSENPAGILNSSSQVTNSMAFGAPFYEAPGGSPWPPGYAAGPAAF